MLELGIGIAIGAAALKVTQKAKRAIKRRLYVEVELILQDKSSPRR
ncbi:hypothetical protein ACFYOF_17120 [Streptomyces sp. NPDC007148]